VFDRTGQVIACSLYRTDMDGFKRFGSGSIIGDETARTFVDQIIKQTLNLIMDGIGVSRQMQLNISLRNLEEIRFRIALQGRYCE
jgi:hypothetical protein